MRLGLSVETPPDGETATGPSLPMEWEASFSAWAWSFVAAAWDCGGEFVSGDSTVEGKADVRTQGDKGCEWW